MWIPASLTQAQTPTAIGLGNFDGLHRGHQSVVRSICQAAGATPTLVTFDPHPRSFFTGVCRPFLTPLDEKIPLLQRMGIAQLVLLKFDEALAQLSAADFVNQILLTQLQARCIAVGENFRFGHKRQGDAQLLRDLAGRADCPVTIVPLEYCQGERISSSAIRQALDTGAIAQATTYLGRPYALYGQVIKGQQLGRTLGFPTANLHVSPQKYLPRSGVYRVRVWCEAVPHWPSAGILGVMNIGMRPTVTDTLQLTLEVHLLDWSGDLYDRALRVELEQFLRPEQKFASLDDLKRQIQDDCVAARSVLTV